MRQSDTSLAVPITAQVEVAMRTHDSSVARSHGVALAVLAVLTAGCASHKHRDPPQFSADAPFSRTFPGSGDAVCWSVKRALLSQGYMLDRPNDAGVLTGTRDEQPQPKLNVTLRLQTSCADNRNGTSIVFVTATREDSQLQKMKQSTSMGVGPATLTMPSGSAQVLGTVRRETIRDPNFYNQFFTLVRGYIAQERAGARSDDRLAQDAAAPARVTQEPPPSPDPHATGPNP
jgi:hypothetical protein